MADKTKVTDTPDQHPGLEPPIKESSQQQGMAPAPTRRKKMMPIGKPGVRVKSKKFGKSTTS